MFGVGKNKRSIHYSHKCMNNRWKSKTIMKLDYGVNNREIILTKYIILWIYHHLYLFHLLIDFLFWWSSVNNVMIQTRIRLCHEVNDYKKLCSSLEAESIWQKAVKLSLSVMRIIVFLKFDTSSNADLSAVCRNSHTRHRLLTACVHYP